MKEVGGVGVEELGSGVGFGRLGVGVRENKVGGYGRLGSGGLG